METGSWRRSSGRRRSLETFLRGMETTTVDLAISKKPALKPSLEGWKRGCNCIKMEDNPTLETFLRGMETMPGAMRIRKSGEPLKPSLEGWKLALHQDKKQQDKILETFLRGMETSGGSGKRAPLICLETFLRGMETMRGAARRSSRRRALKPSLEGWKRNKEGTEGKRPPHP